MKRTECREAIQALLANAKGIPTTLGLDQEIEALEYCLQMLNTSSLRMMIQENIKGWMSALDIPECDMTPNLIKDCVNILAEGDSEVVLNYNGINEALMQTREENTTYLLKTISDWMVKHGTEHTLSGNYIIDDADIVDEFAETGITEAWISYHRDELKEAIDTHEEVLGETWDETDWSSKALRVIGFNMNFGTDYCHYAEEI